MDNKNKFKLVGLLGNAHTGKDTTGELLQDISGTPHVFAFADKIKDILVDLYRLSDEQVRGDQKEMDTQYKCSKCPSCHSMETSLLSYDNLSTCKVCTYTGHSSVFNKFWTPRTMMQFIGDTLRKVNPNVWIDYMQLELDAAMVATKKDKDKTKFIIITDLRYKNECDFVWAKGGEVWRVVRKDAEKETVGFTNHVSESEQKEIPDASLQAILKNDGSKDYLKAQLVVEYNRLMSKE